MSSKVTLFICVLGFICTSCTALSQDDSQESRTVSILKYKRDLASCYSFNIALDEKLTFAIKERETAFERSEELVLQYNILVIKRNKISLRLDKALKLIDKQRGQKWTYGAIGMGAGVAVTSLIILIAAGGR